MLKLVRLAPKKIKFFSFVPQGPFDENQINSLRGPSMVLAW